MLRVLDLFSGTGNFSQGFLDYAGVQVDRIEKDPRFKDVPHTHIMDVLDYRPKPGSHDVIVASPPCDVYTMAGGKQSQLRWVHAKHHFKSPNNEVEGRFPFYGPRLPTTLDSVLGVALVLKTRQIIDTIRPRWSFIENPQGGLQTMGFMDDLPRVTVTYCRYGEPRMKPTTIFGKHPPTWKPRPRCHNGDPCHPTARRGWKTGTQALKTSWERAAVPRSLSREIADAVVQDETRCRCMGYAHETDCPHYGPL